MALKKTEVAEPQVKLVRKAIEVAGLKSLTEEDLMADVKEILGYGELDKAVELRKAAAVLNELGIEPFDNKTVEAYKRAQTKTLNKRRRYYNEYGDARITQTRGIWKSYDLNGGYKKEIPAFALIRAAQTKKAMAAAGVACNFTVEELTKKTNSTTIPRPDPFMVLHVAGKKLYIDVWNEPKFEGRRTK